MSERDLSAYSGLLFMLLLGLAAIFRPSPEGDFGFMLLMVALVGGWALPAAETESARFHTRFVAVLAAGFGCLFILYGVLS